MAGVQSLAGAKSGSANRFQFPFLNNCLAILHVPDEHLLQQARHCSPAYNSILYKAYTQELSLATDVHSDSKRVSSPPAAHNAPEETVAHGGFEGLWPPANFVNARR